MTDLLYLPDADDVTSFTATITDVRDDSIVLDATHFYPEGGGQPADQGTLGWDGGQARVIGVKKDHGDVIHVIDEIQGEPPASGDAVTGEIDAERRERHRRMHTAQHVLSRVVLDEYGASTAGNQIHADRSRIDFEPAVFDDADIAWLEQETNAVLDRDLRVTKAERPRAEVEAVVDEGRALLDLIPESVDPLRVVEIEGFDICPCGGTHVDRLGEVGQITITNRESKGKNTVRLEFELIE